MVSDDKIKGCENLAAASNTLIHSKINIIFLFNLIKGGPSENRI